MKKDIENRNDIELLINSFYDKVKKDKTIGYIFNDVAKVNWEAHLPVMYNFWEGIIFNKSTYNGNPMVVHNRVEANRLLRSNRKALLRLEQGLSIEGS